LDTLGRRFDAGGNRRGNLAGVIGFLAGVVLVFGFGAIMEATRTGQRERIGELEKRVEELGDEREAERSVSTPSDESER
jgi:hypothetical protein